MIDPPCDGVRSLRTPTEDRGSPLDRHREDSPKLTILLATSGHHGNVLKIRPPLVFSIPDADWLATELGEVLAQGA
jgi:4-aminobutyrate aminotransferase-like enzyme